MRRLPSRTWKCVVGGIGHAHQWPGVRQHTDIRHVGTKLARNVMCRETTLMRLDCCLFHLIGLGIACSFTLCLNSDANVADQSLAGNAVPLLTLRRATELAIGMRLVPEGHRCSCLGGAVAHTLSIATKHVCSAGTTPS